MAVPFKTIRLGPFDIALTHLQSEDERINFATYSANEQSISMARKFSTPRQEAETLLHELLHAVYELMAIKAKDGEERIITSMSVGVAMLIRDNPKLIQWMTKILAE